MSHVVGFGHARWHIDGGHVGIVEGTGNPELARLAQTTRLSEPAHLIIFTKRCRCENPGFL